MKIEVVLPMYAFCDKSGPKIGNYFTYKGELIGKIIEISDSPENHGKKVRVTIDKKSEKIVRGLLENGAKIGVSLVSE
jgi:hypothetical protein